MSIKSFANIKKELNGLKLKTNLGDAQKRVEKLIKNAEKDLKKLIESNIPDVMKKFQEEKAQIEIMVDKIIKEEIKKFNSVSGSARYYEQVRDYRLLGEAFEVGVELTNLFKIKRHIIEKKYGEVINDIYKSA